MSVRNSAMARVEAGWNELDALIDSLGRQGLSVKGRDGWAVKDHLFHIAAWERSTLALLQGVDRSDAMGAAGLSEVDDINHAVWLRHKDESPEAALHRLHSTHAELMAALEPLTDADLELPYKHYQPNDSDSASYRDRPFRDWVAGNTWEHYTEHVEWINQLIKESSAAR